MSNKKRKKKRKVLDDLLKITAIIYYLVKIIKELIWLIGGNRPQLPFNFNSFKNNMQDLILKIAEVLVLLYVLKLSYKNDRTKLEKGLTFILLTLIAIDIAVQFIK